MSLFWITLLLFVHFVFFILSWGISFAWFEKYYPDYSGQGQKIFCIMMSIFGAASLISFLLTVPSKEKPLCGLKFL